MEAHRRRCCGPRTISRRPRLEEHRSARRTIRIHRERASTARHPRPSRTSRRARRGIAASHHRTSLPPSRLFPASSHFVTFPFFFFCEGRRRVILSECACCVWRVRCRRRLTIIPDRRTPTPAATIARYHYLRH
jgi:hypothetical protein